MKKIAYIARNTDISKAVDETGDNELKEPAIDIAMALKLELPATIKVKVHSAFKAAENEMLGILNRKHARIFIRIVMQRQKKVCRSPHASS